MQNSKLILPPNLWSDPNKHFHEAVSHPWYKLVFDLSTTLYWSTVDFFRAERFAPAWAPITTNSISSPMGAGSDSLPVQIQLFDERTYLADSMQFYLEYLLRVCDTGVFYIMPTFRGEMPDERHLNQFFHAEAEMRGELGDVIQLVERYIQFCTKRILESHVEFMNKSGFRVSHIEDIAVNGFINTPRITFAEAANILGEDDQYYSNFDGKVIRLSNNGERALMEKHGGTVWVTHFPREGVPFYQATDISNTDVSLCADLLLGIGETVGAGQRSFSHAETLEELAFRGVHANSYNWYLQMKEYYPIKTSGFGMGLERFMLWVLEHNDIRDIPLIPRMRGHTSIL